MVILIDENHHRIATPIDNQPFSSIFYGYYEYQWIGLRVNLQESPIFNGKIYGFL
jgi:hypothetical protein